MPAFSYTAIDAQGQEQKGVLEGDSARQLRNKLREQDLLPLNVEPIAEKQQVSKQTALRKAKKLSAKDLSSISRQLATLLTAGMPLTDALQTIVEQAEKNHVKNIISGVQSGILEGHTLADSMENFSAAFPQIYRATIAAGEQSGRLETVLERLADFTEKQYYNQQKTQQALIYPALMTLVSFAILIFLLTYVVPRMVNVFSQTGQQLPMATQILLAISSAVKAYWLYGFATIVILIIIFRQMLKSEGFNYSYHNFLLHFPVVGKTLKVISTARFARSLGILVAASVPILEAMAASNKLIALLPIRRAIEGAIVKVREGINVSSALRQCHYFPPMSIHLIASGESSGRLEEMLERAADNQERDVNMLIDSSLKLFEPALIVFMGAVILFIVLAILLPIFALDQFAG